MLKGREWVNKDDITLDQLMDVVVQSTVNKDSIAMLAEEIHDTLMAGPDDLNANAEARHKAQAIYLICREQANLQEVLFDEVGRLQNAEKAEEVNHG